MIVFCFIEICTGSRRMAEAEGGGEDIICIRICGGTEKLLKYKQRIYFDY